MLVASFTCPRCLNTAPHDGNSRFCARCGLLAEPSFEPFNPSEVTVGGAVVALGKGLAFGDISNLYRCTGEQIGGVGVIKITRSHHANPHLAREMETLQNLLAADDGRFAPFVPRPCGTANIEQARLGALLKYHDGIAGPDDLYSLTEVGAAYPNGIDARDMAWMWRRLLTVLGFAHARGIVHGVVTPDHILIEPRDHKLVLIGWCGAVQMGQPLMLVPQRWRDWIDATQPASPATDLGCASRSMSFLLNSQAESAIIRHIERAAVKSDAWKLLADFDRLIEAMWGPRSFRPFWMPEHQSTQEQVGQRERAPGAN